MTDILTLDIYELEDLSIIYEALKKDTPQGISTSTITLFRDQKERLHVNITLKPIDEVKTVALTVNMRKEGDEDGC